MMRRGYGDEFIRRFRKMNEFHLQVRREVSHRASRPCVAESPFPSQRIPIIILVSGGYAAPEAGYGDGCVAAVPPSEN